MHDYLITILQEANLLLQEGPLNAAQMKTKLGIKATAISDDDMTSLMSITQDKKQLVALARYTIETKDLQQVKAYGAKMMELDPKLDPQRFQNFTRFTEYIDSKVPKQKGSGFDLDSQKPDWQSQDGRYRVYKTDGRNDCIKYGHGQTFCISRANSGNLWYHYRSNQQSNFYFVFDTSLDPEKDNTYITVIDALADNKFEFTHKNNDTPTTSEHYGYSLDNFLDTKPGLEQARAFFQPKPQTPEEKQEAQLWSTVYGEGTFSELSREQQFRFIAYGRYTLDSPDIEKMDSQMQNEYVTVFGSRTPSYDLPAFEYKQQIRIVGECLSESSIEMTDLVVDIVTKNLNKFYFKLAFDGGNAPNGMYAVKWNSTLELLTLVDDPLPILQRYKPEQWDKSIEATIGRHEANLDKFCHEAKHFDIIADYTKSETLKRGFSSMKGNNLYDYLRSSSRVAGDSDKVQASNIIALFSDFQYTQNILKYSPIAYEIFIKCANQLKQPIRDCWYNIMEDVKEASVMISLNVYLTSPDPMKCYQLLPLKGKNYLALSPTLLVEFIKKCMTDQRARGILLELIDRDWLQSEYFTMEYWDARKQGYQVKNTLAQVADYFHKIMELVPKNNLNEAYLNKFWKIVKK